MALWLLGCVLAVCWAQEGPRDVIARVTKRTFNTERSRFGIRVRGGSDLDNDGVMDAVVAIDGFDWGTNVNTGAAQILYLNSDGTVDASSALFDVPQRSIDRRFGSAVDGSCGDVNGDGFSDILIGSRGENSDTGGAYLVAGTGTREERPTEVLLALHDHVGEFSLDFNGMFGYAVGCVGDIDGNGVMDIAVGAYRDHANGSESGAVYVFLLENQPLTVRSVVKLHTTVGDLTIDSWAGFGSGVGGLGDLDGDGVPDLVVGARYHADAEGQSVGGVYVLCLHSNGTVRDARLITQGSEGFDASLDIAGIFGDSVDGVGDIDNDGVVDIIVGAQMEGPEDSGEAYLLLLTSHGGVKEAFRLNDQVDLNVQIGEGFGSGVGALGDVNGDGVPDYVIGSRREDTGGVGAGAVYIIISDPSVITRSNTPSPSPSLSDSISLSPSLTPSMSPSTSDTLSLSPSFSPSRTSSVSPTPSPSAEPYELRVTALSDNPNSPHLATHGDMVFVNLVTSVSVFNPFVDIAGIPAQRVMYRDLSTDGTHWQASFLVEEGDDSNRAWLGISATVFNIDTHSVTTTVTGSSSVVIDTMPPQLITATITSTNSYTNAIATVGDRIDLLIEVSEDTFVNHLTMLGSETNITIEGEGTSRILLSRTVVASVPSGPVTFHAILTDSAGNRLTVDCLTAGEPERGCPEAVVDKEPPLPTSLRVYSSNLFTNTLARIGDRVTVYLEATEAIARLNGSSAHGVPYEDLTVAGLGTSDVTLQFVVAKGMEDGEIWFRLVVSDIVGNGATYSNFTTDNSTVRLVTSEPRLFVTMRGAGLSLFNVLGGEEVLVSVDASAPIGNVSVLVNDNPALSIIPHSGFSTRFLATYPVRDDEPIGAMAVTVLFSDLNGNPSRHNGVSDGRQIRPRCAVGYVKDNSTSVCRQVPCPARTVGWPACRCVDGMSGQLTFQHELGYSADCEPCDVGYVTERVEDLCVFENDTTSTQTLCVQALCPDNTAPDSFPECECDINQGYYGVIAFQPARREGYMGECVKCSECGFFSAERRACTSSKDVECYTVLDSVSPFFLFLVALGIPSVGAIWSMSRFSSNGDQKLKSNLSRISGLTFRSQLMKQEWKKLNASFKALYGFLDAASDVSFVLFNARGYYRIASATFVAVPLLSCLLFSVSFFVRAFHNQTFAGDFLSDRTRAKMKKKLHRLMWVLLTVSFNPRLIEVFLHHNYPIKVSARNRVWTRRLRIFPSAMIVLENLPQIIIQTMFTSSERLSFFVLFSLTMSIMSLVFEVVVLVAYLRQRGTESKQGQSVQRRSSVRSVATSHSDTWDPAQALSVEPGRKTSSNRRRGSFPVPSPLVRTHVVTGEGDVGGPLLGDVQLTEVRADQVYDTNGKGSHGGVAVEAGSASRMANDAISVLERGLASERRIRASVEVENTELRTQNMALMAEIKKLLETGVQQQAWKEI